MLRIAAPNANLLESSYQPERSNVGACLHATAQDCEPASVGWQPDCYRHPTLAGSQSWAVACKHAPTLERSGWYEDSRRFAFGAAILNMQSCWLTRLAA